MTTDNPTSQAGTVPSTQKGSASGDPARRLKDDADAALETAKHDLDRVRSEAEEVARDILNEAQRQFDRAAEKAKGMAQEQKDSIAAQLESMAAAVAKLADELEGDQHATAGYARSVANGMRRFSQGLRERDLDELVAMGEDFGRRQPAAFMGIAALAGFAASRFLLASARRRQERLQGGYQSSADFGSSGSTYPDGGNKSQAMRDSTGGTI